VPIRAVLFDVGGPINTEVAHERAIDDDIIPALAAEGLAVSPEGYAEAWRCAVDSFAPNAYTAVIWRLTGQDPDISRRIYADVAAASHSRGAFELRDGVADLLEKLHNLGLRLGLAANQPAQALQTLEKHGIARWFHYQQVSGTHGFRKPDVRVFLHACESLGVAPSESIMVGDRIDCDIAPATALGLRTVRIVTGRHANQRPRSWDEVPDAEVHDVAGMEAAILALLAAAV
jgi:HAD superfamily hydrolase (TIGR01549 family)